MYADRRRRARVHDAGSQVERNGNFGKLWSRSTQAQSVLVSCRPSSPEKKSFIESRNEEKGMSEREGRTYAMI